MVHTLSICIPTHNRSDFLISNLNIIKKLPGAGEIEILIADDGSTDDTEQKVKDFSKKHKKLNIKYIKNKKQIFFDRIVLQAVEKASGKFVWLISDDDEPERHALKKIFEVLRKHPDVSLIHMNYSRYDNFLKKVTAKKMVGSVSRDIYFENESEFFFKEVEKSYFKFLGTNVITMSTDIVNRKKWLKEAKALNKFIGHNFIHCFVIGAMIKKSPKIYYIAKPNVQYLANNHRVWPNDIWKDYRINFLGFLEKIGYNPVGVEKMSKALKKDEKKESFMSNSVTKHIFNILRPVYALYKYLLDKIS